ncbi:MAG TPA: class I SAM-dependent methyltransferase [Vicinamibacterales bacterium]|nr:class I SAM-dependent methyltransferase [Vicinamibacterales bacterium]
MNVDHRYTQTQHRYAADDLETMSEARNYQAHLFDLVGPHVGLRVLEVGCGIGTMTRQLLDQAERVVCIEPNLNCAARAREALDGNQRVAIRVCHLEECSRGELQEERFDTVVCVNVLEHIEDDVRALALFRDVVAGTSGRVVIFVPAIQAIYGPHDAALGHHRRYSKQTLRAAFAAASLDVVSMRYTNPMGLLGWMYNRYVTGNTEHTTTQVRLFDRFVAPWALPLERVFPPPIGLSLFAVGRARPHSA